MVCRDPTKWTIRYEDIDYFHIETPQSSQVVSTDLINDATPSWKLLASVGGNDFGILQIRTELPRPSSMVNTLWEKVSRTCKHLPITAQDSAVSSREGVWRASLVSSTSLLKSWLPFLRLKDFRSCRESLTGVCTKLEDFLQFETDKSLELARLVIRSSRRLRTSCEIFPATCLQFLKASPVLLTLPVC